MTITLEIGPRGHGLRLDRALAMAASGTPGLSRSRLAQLLAGASISRADGAPIAAKPKAAAGERYVVKLPPPAPAEPMAEAIPLSILHEDAHLVVIDKPAGMVVHPAPGAENGTLVNALLHHCGASLAGIGGERRPGIVHRIDKDTSGLLVVAKTQAAHEGLARQFAAHSTHRRYLALARGAPDRGDPRLMGHAGVSASAEGFRIETEIARHPHDRQRMAVTRAGGRRAVTHFTVLERYGSASAPISSLIACRLETGRTHQIRVHASHIGHALIGDPVYARPRPLPKDTPAEIARALTEFPRQALHAAELGFVHPATDEALRFEAPPPADLAEVIGILRRNTSSLR